MSVQRRVHSKAKQSVDSLAHSRTSEAPRAPESQSPKKRSLPGGLFRRANSLSPLSKDSFAAFSQLFRDVIAQSPLYAELLSQIKAAYDKQIAELQGTVDSLSDSTLTAKLRKHEREISNLEYVNRNLRKEFEAMNLHREL